jgi:hypothetical protein
LGYAFYNCAGLLTVTFSTVVPPTFGLEGPEVFTNVPDNAIAYVPLATTDLQLATWTSAVRAAGWPLTGTVTRSPT